LLENMMRKLLPLCIALASLASFTAAAHAIPLPVGTYGLTATTPTSGIHSGSDEGTLTGTLIFDAASNITFANLAFDDTTVGMIFHFTNPGPVTIQTPPGLLSANIFNAADPNQLFAFSIRIPSNANGTFTLTCGTDCDNWMLIDTGGKDLTYVEVTGLIDPAPEPSTIALLGTGTLAILGAFRRTLRRRIINA
jgi:hypothetical protein